MWFGQRKDRDIFFDRTDRSFVHRESIGDALMPGVWGIDLELIDQAWMLQIGIDQCDLQAGLGSGAGQVHRNGGSTDASLATGDRQNFQTGMIRGSKVLTDSPHRLGIDLLKFQDHLRPAKRIDFPARRDRFWGIPWLLGRSGSFKLFSNALRWQSRIGIPRTKKRDRCLAHKASSFVIPIGSYGLGGVGTSIYVGLP